MPNPPPFSFKSPDEYEQIQIELAGLASDMRILGFNEETIKRWLSKMWTKERKKAILSLIQRCKKLQAEYALEQFRLLEEQARRFTS